MSDQAQTEGSQGIRHVLLDSLAWIGAGVSIVFCYAQVLISLMAPLFGFGAFEINVHAQAVFMWGFALLTVYGLVRDRTHHHSNLPLGMGLGAVAVIAGTLYLFYDVRILIIGYVLLVFSALSNQYMKLRKLSDEVHEKSAELEQLNESLEERVAAQVAEIERLAVLKRFLSEEVVELVTSEDKQSLLESHRRLIACLFCDVRNFTTFSDSVEPEEVMDMLQVIHERMGQLVSQHGGTIGYRTGDGLMVLFNDPLPCEAPVQKAVALAEDMMKVFAETRERWHGLGHQIGLGVGISYGYATLGMIGTEGRRDYTAIGNVVNLAARLCGKAQDGEILVDKRCKMELEGVSELEAVGSLELKGLRAQVESFRVLGPSDGRATAPG